MSRSPVLLSVVFAIAVSACGGDSVVTTDTSVTSGPDSTPVDTGPDDSVPSDSVPSDSVPAVTFLSEPVQAGPLLGSGSGESAAADAVSVEPCLDDENCDTRPPDVVPPLDPFVPAAADEAFCTLLFDLESRPFPSDELEALIVAEAWFAELAPTVPSSQQADFAVLTAWLDRAVASQGQIGFDDLDPELDAASERLGDYVDTNCYGRGEPIDPPPPPDTDEPPTTDGATRRSGPVFGDEAQRLDDEDPDAFRALDHPRSIDDVAFCDLLDEMAERNISRTDAEQLEEAQGLLRELSPLVPTAIRDPFEVLSAWLDDVLAAGTLDTELFDDEQFNTAIENVNVYVDANCYGLG